VAYEKPLPKVTREDRAFWQAAKEGRLLLPRCLDCGHVWFPPYLSCPRCASARIEWTEASGRGVIWGRIEMHQAYLKSFADVMPYNVVQVQLAEGPMIFSNVEGAAWDDLAVGDSVEVVFEDVTDEIALPKFRLA